MARDLVPPDRAAGVDDALEAVGDLRALLDLPGTYGPRRGPWA